MRKYTFVRIWEDFFVIDKEDYELTEICLTLEINDKDLLIIDSELSKAYDNWMYENCENSILINEETSTDDLLGIPIFDYLISWLEKKEIEFIPVE